MNIRSSDADRFFAKIDVRSPEECWNWTGSKDTYGYGHIWVDGKLRIASRFAWELSTGERPGKWHVLHTCDNPACCNPGHLMLGTHQENMRQMHERGLANPLRGEDHPDARVTEGDVREIRKLYATGEYRQQDLAERYGINQVNISAIVRRKNWAHIQ